MTKLRLEEVSFAYGSEPVIKEVSLKLEAGVFYGIVGPNGAGKSTLLKLLDRYLLPQSGTIFLDNRNLNSYSLRELAQEVALIPQTSHYFPFTVREVVQLGRTPFNSRFQQPTLEDSSIVEASMEATGVTHLAGRLISDLSGGERQRVTIARAFAQQTKVLLLDEPTTHLDLEHQIRTCQLLQARSKQGVLSVAVLHDLNLVANYCDYVFVLNQGELVREGPPGEVFTPALIEEIYNVSVPAIYHPKTGRPIIVP
jgi:iron complex transport system ATP-binding protein